MNVNFLNTVILGQGIEEISDFNGEEIATNKLTLIVLTTNDPPTVNTTEHSGTFLNLNSNLRILVPENAVDTYKNDENWKILNDRIFADIEDNYYFEDNDRVIYNSEDKKVLLFAPIELSGDFLVPDSVEEIAESAFAHCKELSSVTISINTIVIGKGSFYDTDNLIINSAYSEKPDGYSEDWIESEDNVIYSTN